MPSQQTDTVTVTEWLSLNRLDPPETDVRAHRDRDQLRQLAQSLERSGQLQAAQVYPVQDDEPLLDADADRDDLRDALDQADAFRVVDGWSRREAARIANWDRLRCEIHPQPPDDQIVASLDANTERLDMSDYETIQALADLKDQQGLTDAEIADKVGKSRSTISNYFRALDGYEPARLAWQDPDSHIEIGHVLTIESLPTEQLKEKVLQDALEFDRSVTMTRKTAENTVKGWKRQQAKDDSQQASKAQGTKEQAAAEKARRDVEANQDPPCILCGDRGAQTIALPVCEEDYGLLTRKKTTGEPLLASLPDVDDDQPDAEETPDSN